MSRGPTAVRSCLGCCITVLCAAAVLSLWLVPALVGTPR